MAALHPENSGRSRWLPIVIVLALVAMLLAVRGHTGAGVLAPPDVAKEARGPAPLQGEFEAQRPAGTAVGGGTRQPAATTANMRIYVSQGSYDAPAAAALAGDLEEAVGYVQQRTGMQLARPVNVVFDRRKEACGLDAVAYTDVRTLMLYTCPHTPSRRAVNVLAHEVVHQLAHDHYGAPHLRADVILSEGLATWGAGRYWLGHYTSFHDFVAREYAGRLVPLATEPSGSTTDSLNQLYYEWAAYIEWLRLTYGPAVLDRLYASGSGRQAGSADYAGTLGTTLAETETRWRAWLDRPAEVAQP